MIPRRRCPGDTLGVSRRCLRVTLVCYHLAPLSLRLGPSRHTTYCCPNKTQGLRAVPFISLPTNLGWSCGVASLAPVSFQQNTQNHHRDIHLCCFLYIVPRFRKLCRVYTPASDPSQCAQPRETQTGLTLKSCAKATSPNSRKWIRVAPANKTRSQLEGDVYLYYCNTSLPLPPNFPAPA